MGMRRQKFLAVISKEDNQHFYTIYKNMEIIQAHLEFYSNMALILTCSSEQH